MDLTCSDEETSSTEASERKQEVIFIKTTSNWNIENDKNLNDCISTALLLEAPNRTNLEDVVSLDTCIALKADPLQEPCRLEFKTTNKQKIARIAVVSESSVLEFYKQSGEYQTTVFAEFVDEFQDHSVYFGEAEIQPPSSEASVKFTRTKNRGKVVWVYGIKLILTEALDVPQSPFDLEVINSYISNSNNVRPDLAKRFMESFTSSSDNSQASDMTTCLQKLASMNWSSSLQENDGINNLDDTNVNSKCNGDLPPKSLVDLKKYIDNRFSKLEMELLNKIELMEKNVNYKLDLILKKLEQNVNNT